MKTLLAIFFMAFTLAAEARTLKCYSKDDEGALFSVTITELEDVSDSVSFSAGYDYVYRVKVNVNLEQFLGSRFALVKSFEAHATVVDLSYNVSAVKDHGFKFSTNLDKLDQSTLSLVSKSGDKTATEVSCR